MGLWFQELDYENLPKACDNCGKISLLVPCNFSNNGRGRSITEETTSPQQNIERYTDKEDSEKSKERSVVRFKNRGKAHAANEHQMGAQRRPESHSRSDQCREQGGHDMQGVQTRNQNQRVQTRNQSQTNDQRKGGQLINSACMDAMSCTPYFDEGQSSIAPKEKKAMMASTSMQQHLMKKSKEAIPKHLRPKHADGGFDPNHSENASLGSKRDSLFPGNSMRKGNHHSKQTSHDFSEGRDTPSIVDSTHVNKGKHATDHICQPNLST